VAAIGASVDLAVVAVPAAAVRDVVADCAAAGVGAAVILTAGLAEAGTAGAAAQADIVRLDRAHGLRLVGPNCLGVINTDPAIRLTATFAPSLPAAGGLAIASQSGAVGVAILASAARTKSGRSAGGQRAARHTPRRPRPRKSRWTRCSRRPAWCAPTPSGSCSTPPGC
jgi:acyl-CoA synthetase (NDP forming)